MTHNASGVVWYYAVAAAVLTGVPARGADQTPVELTLHPMAASSPALKYRLLPTYTEQISGNAAVYYGKIKAEEDAFFGNRDLSDKINDVWHQMPLEQLKLEDFKSEPAAWPVYFLEQGAKCKYCDWQLPIGREPFYTILLPEAQESRRFSRMLAVKARWEVAMSRYDQAIQTFQTNYALARNVAQGETLVNGLIGIAECELIFPQVVEYLQQPNAPNLYWALTDLPQPMISFRRALEVESQALELSFPDLRDAANSKRTPEEWRELFNRFANEVLAWNHAGNSLPEKKTPEELDKLCNDFVPAGKKMLLADSVSVEVIDTMSPHQLALVCSVRTYQILFDDAARGFSLPYPIAKQSITAAIERCKHSDGQVVEVIPITQNSLQAISTCRSALARCERQFAVLRIFEALRIYGAAHDGKLAKSLGDISEVPVPSDPVTGEPFDYHLEGDKAILKGPTFRDVPVNYAITMAASGK